jgi:RNA polymerase sigma-70 factor (ECF subfamily)
VRRVGVDLADDVVNQVFLVAWRRREQVPHEGTRLWLFAVARRVVANELRTKHRRERLVAKMGLVVGEEPMTADDLGNQGVNSAIHDALARLSNRERESLIITEWDELSISEAAMVAGCSPATFRVRLHRARRNIARHLESDARYITDQGRTEAPTTSPKR